MKKFELTTDTKMHFGRKLFRIKALVSFGDVKEGTLGGYVEKEENLDHEGNAWVYDDAWVCDNAIVYGNAMVCGSAMVCDRAMVRGNAKVYGNAWVCGNAMVCDRAMVRGSAKVYDDAWVCDNADVYGNACVYGDAKVYGNAMVCGSACVCGDARLCGNTDYATVKGFGTQCRSTTFFRCEDRKIRVACGCFKGTIEDFRKRVKATRSGKIEKEYLMIADLMELHFEEESEE